ncbi:hypothetical protein CAPTEDRAFT_203170 [Capitella teleta]|uniref:Uncharacterized protein n=1 Tax=Capitella teleta TaxID=283909 RepID=R7UEU2_CAPTE|nr:hypothetical protein CAPTEDRAFT_203170 [Capitella teleta]|eukprot:ELU01802.1 hypothetical protein CAPTEDRAFT_203170 [Capitella teleta]
MGSSSSKSKQKKKGHNLCPDLPLWAPEWTTLLTLANSHMKRLPENLFPRHPECHQKMDDPSGNRWNTGSCSSAILDRANFTLLCTQHGQPRQMNYGYNRLFKALMDDAHLEGFVPGSMDYLSLHFSLENLSDTKQHMVCMLSDKEVKLMYFFLEKWHDDLQLHQCVLSTDRTYLVLLVSQADTYDMHVYSKRPAAYDTEYQGSMFEMECLIPGILSWNGPPKVIFSPSFGYSRLALVNVESIHWENTNSYVATYDLLYKRPNLLDLCEHRLYNDVELIDAMYSRNGEFIAVMVSHNSGNELVVYSADSMLPIKTFQQGYLNCCFLNTLPVFSISGRQMVLRTTKSLSVVQLPAAPSLKAMCRDVVLSSTSSADIEKMLVSHDIKNYLLFISTKY